MGRLIVRRWRTRPGGRLARQAWLSAGLVLLAVVAARLPVPAAGAVGDGVRHVLVTDFDAGPVLQALDGMADMDGGDVPDVGAPPGDVARGGTLAVTAIPAGGADVPVPSFTSPVPPGRILSWFGWRVGADGRQEHHPGVDLEARRGEAVRAPLPGVVSKVGNDPAGYGRYVILSHGDGWETLYAHNDRILVASGQEVRQGQPIARVGQTGNATAPHVHVEVRLAGTPVDPAPYLGLARE